MATDDDTQAPAPAPPPLPAAAAVDFALLLGALKRTPRTGWLRSGVPPAVAESISDHSHRLSALALVAAFSGGLGGGGAAATAPPLDVSRCVRMAVVHDIAEAIVGDITPHCGVSEEDKHAREAAAMERIAALLSGVGGGGGGEGAAASSSSLPDGALSAAARDVRALWREYEAGETSEARLVKDLDRLEMLVQALEYEQQGVVVVEEGGSGGDGGGGGGGGGNEQQQQRPLQSFFNGCRGKWRTPLGEAWAAEIEKRRPGQQQQ